jgi:hypothetical protein
VWYHEIMVRWKLKEILEKEGFTAYRLWKTAKSNPHTVYRWAYRPPKALDLEVAEAIVRALRALTGKPYGLCDLIELEIDSGNSGKRVGGGVQSSPQSHF